MGSPVDPATLLEQLRDDLGFRRIAQGIGRLEQIRPMIENLEPAPGTGVLAGLVAQWVDAGFDGPALLRNLLARFPSSVRPSLTLLDYLHIRMIEGLLAMTMEEYDRACAHFILVQSFEEE